MKDVVAFNKELFREHMMQKRLIERRLTTRDASKEIGISPATISRIEKGGDITIHSFCLCLKWLNTSSCNYFWDTPVKRMNNGIR